MNAARKQEWIKHNGTWLQDEPGLRDALRTAHPGLMFAGRRGSYQVGRPVGLGEGARIVWGAHHPTMVDAVLAAGSDSQ